MRVTLLHNPGAGQAYADAATLRGWISSAGHKLDAYHTIPIHPGDFDEMRSDLLVVAGGNGTVRQGMIIAAERGIPVTILALGTANNLAGSLGIGAPSQRLVHGWTAGEVRSFDIGSVAHPTGVVHVVEGAGVGVIAEVMRAGSTEDWGASGGRYAQMVEARRRLKRRLALAAAEEVGIDADGDDLSGRYLVVEVLNTPRIGAALELGPGADPGDGWLDLVLLPAREAWSSYPLRLRGGGPPWRIRRVKRVDLDVAEIAFHIDGMAQMFGGGRISVRAGPKRVRVLVPPPREA